MPRGWPRRSGDCRPRPVPLLPVRVAPLVVESERVERAVVRADVDLTEAAPEAARRRGSSSWPCRYSTTACRSRRRRRGERGRASPVAVGGRPVASANTTPLTMIGVAGETRSCETHPGSSESAPPASISFSASTAPCDTGAIGRRQCRGRRPLTGTESTTCRTRSCHAARASALTVAPAPRNGFDARSGVA